MSATVAIAPFDNLSGDPAQDYFARGFVEDVATELSRFGTLEVLHPRAFGAAALDADSARPAPAAHVVHGSVRRTGSSVRVNVQLVEAANGRQLWADRYDATAADLLAVQDAIAARIASTLAVRINEARLGIARRAPLASLEAYDCWLRGLERLRTGSVEADAEARGFFERALEIDPGYARAYAGISLTHFNEWSCQAWVKWDEKERLAHEYARRALALDETDAMVQIVLGRILVYRRQYDEAAHHVERALLLNPNDTDVLVHAGLCQAYLGDPEAALATGTKATAAQPCASAVVRRAGWSRAVPARSRCRMPGAGDANHDVRGRAGVPGRRLCVHRGHGVPVGTCAGSSTTSRNASASDAPPSRVSRFAGCCT